MRPIVISDIDSQPFCVIAVHDKTTTLPVFCLSNYGIGENDSDTVLLQGVRVPIKVCVENLKYTESRPASLGSGITRKECSFDIIDGGPFSLAPFSAKMYSAGANIDSFYFSLWVTDFKYSLKELADVATFLGYFDLDAGLGWDEKSLVTSIRLVNRLTMLYGRYNTITESAEELLAGSEYQQLLDAPAHLGFKSKVQAYGRAAATISGFDSYNKSVQGVIAGLVTSDELSGTSIQLGKSPTLALVVGQTLKVKMGNGCLIQGVITDLGSGNYGIDTTGLLLNQAWDTLLVYNKGWTAVGDPLNATTTDLSSIFLDSTVELTRLPSPTMYIRTVGTIELYNGGPVTVGPLFCKLTGISDEANMELSCELLKDPANTTYLYGGVSVEFDAAPQNTAWSEDGSTHLNYAKWLDKQACPLYFTDETYVLADIQKIGMPWEIIITPHVNSTVPLTYDYYIRLIGNTTIAESTTGTPAIYADNGTSLIPIDTTKIDEIAYSTNDFGLPDLCKITITQRLSDIDEAYNDGYIYVDTSRVMYAAELITFVLDSAGIPEELRAYSLREGTNKLGNPMALTIADETWTDLLETLLFESGLKMDEVAGFYHVRTAFNEVDVRTFNNTADPSQTFQYVQTTGVIQFSDVINGSYKMDIGRTLTNIDAAGREFIRTHYTFSYTYSNYNGQKLRKLQSVKAAKTNDRVIAYEFKHIGDTLTANAAATQLTRLGHIANIPETTRTVTVDLPYKYMSLQALDSVRLANFRHVTALNDPLPAYNDASASNPVYTLGTYGPYAKYNATTPYMLLPGIGIVDSITMDFSGGSPVTITFKQVQPGTTSNVRAVAEKIDINTTTDNDTDETTGGTSSTVTTPYVCPDYGDGDGNTYVTNVIITPGEVKASGITISDSCCNSTTTDSDTEGDPKVTVICGGGSQCPGHTDNQPPTTDVLGNPTGSSGSSDDCPWPDGCVDNSNIYYEAETDNTIGSTDSLIFDIYSFNARCPALTSITYQGRTVPDTCVQYAPSCQDGSGNVIVGKLIVNPCIFNTPENVYSKAIELVFTVQACHTEFPNGRFKPGITIWTPKQFHIIIPVSLRPVSDINIG